MTALLIRILTCDGTDDGEVCAAEFGGDPDVPSIAALREQAKPDGWHSADGRDLCPAHRPHTDPKPEEG